MSSLFKHPPTTETHTLSLHDALPISGGNATGLSLDPGAEIAGKMLQLLKEAAPHISRLALLTVPSPNLQMWSRSEEHTSELQSRRDLVCRLLLEKKKRSRVRRSVNEG